MIAQGAVYIPTLDFLAGAGATAAMDGLSWLGAAALFVAVPLLAAACGFLYWQQLAITRRLDRHAESIAHMDDWADAVEPRLKALEDHGRRRGSSLVTTARPPTDPKRWWQN